MNRWFRMWPIVSLALLGACARQEVAPAPAAALPQLQPVATVKQVMQSITVPASNAVFGVASEPPTDDAAWVAVENSALAVAESANLLLMEGRAKDREAWAQHALAMLEAANAAAAAARTKDAEKVSEAGNTLYETCESCHRKYMPQSAT